MFELPTQFTGTNCELLSFEEFTRLSYALQILHDLHIEAVREYDYPKNYYEAIIDDGREKFSFLQNCYVPYACFRSMENERIYYDKPELAEIINTLGVNITVLDSTLLSMTIHEQHLSALTAGEREEVKRWLPTTMGSVMFSWFFD